MSSDLKLFPDPVLRRKAAPVKIFDSRLADLIARMDTCMRSQAHGIGIAAPQLGVSVQAAVVDVSGHTKDGQRLVLVNPVIMESREERISREGCMSFPDYTCQLKRFDWIRLVWQDEKGRFHEKTASGIEAVCIQHEVDHLQGQLIIDRVTSLKRDLIPRRIPRKS